MIRGLIVALAGVGLLAMPTPGQAAPPVCDHGVLVVDQGCLNPDFSGGYQECSLWISVNYQRVMCATDR